jgi:hypothetical protein
MSLMLVSHQTSHCPQPIVEKTVKLRIEEIDAHQGE